jgi:hypothetical protein
MEKRDLKKLNKEQLEDVLLELYQIMDSKALANEKMSKKIDIMNDPGYFSYHAALRTMCNWLKIKTKSLS